ncbi:MAG: RHS repeat domain-containing protein [Armatimonadota bacterium]
MIEESVEGGATIYYIREPGGFLIARLHPTDGVRYYHFDELGSTRLLTDADGDITDRYAYDAYGSLLSHDCYSGSVEQSYQYVGQLGYYTHWMEPDFGLLQLGVRFYDPEVGRFTQRDPMQNDHAPYTYAGDEPTRLVDPQGTFPVVPVIIGGAVGVVDLLCVRDAFNVGADWRDKPNDLAFQRKWGKDAPVRAHFMAHCVAACLATRCLPGCLRSTLGRTQAQGLGLAAELWQALWNLISNIWDREWNPLNDAWAPALMINETGALCGLSRGTCYDCCDRKYDARNRKD